MTVPNAPPEPEFDADALYALADAEREAAANAPSQHRVVEPSAPVKAAPAARGSAIPRGAAGMALGYQRGATAREIERGNSIIDMPRDLYVPLALFIVGLAIYVAYYAVHYQLRSSAIAGVIFGLFLLTMFKAALLVGFALVMANPLGVSFGGIWSAVLKLAALAVFCDGITTWVDAGVEKMAGGGGAFAGMLSFPVALAIYWTLLIYLFSMDPGDSWMVVVILSIFDFVVRWVMLMILLKIVLSWGGVALPAGVPGGGGGGGSSSMSSDSLAVEVQEMKDSNQLEEAKKYIEGGRQEILRPSVDAWYAAGCKNVWFTVSRDINGRGTPGGVIVELPKDKKSRAKCYAILKAYYDGAQIEYEDEDVKDTGDQYLSVEIRSSH
ncbi:MAG: hypothetical protein H7Z14_14405 [Anaerolineae bacterium]|nr:hypothetical protein [Phycisphaerae bacterium]